MMGAQHAACGAAAWVVVASDYGIPISVITQPLAETFDWLSWLPETLPLGLGMLDVGPAGVLLGAVICAGAALLPDIDHHNASIAHSLPPVSMAMARFFQTASGGHRNGTHSIVGVLFFAVVAWLAGFIAIEDVGILGDLNIGAGLIAVILSAFAFKVLRFMPKRARKVPWVAGISFGVLTTLLFPEGPIWLMTCVVLGVVVHIAGDMLTKEGCNLLWPFRLLPPRFVKNGPILSEVWSTNGYLSLPLLGSADSIRSWAFTIPVSLVAMTGMSIATVVWAQQLWAVVF
ncbi:metal-dependent hydrolase [Enteractinococcus fodinae]|uniref:Membrane-bound metal-dependent hydrolase YbcI (DUF457 family) n=1 Tax=Enteractinococcus fodinae TaxID=684663 RepID=A0ABU2B027_9MICC|nr:metal-dependent hydrolase [Enteractinococcus fodinae]MDR7346960.1 membrane-bound metal-dependent hydrolase YbcI (DUF457 family) [Enteractinococcus fodinae]